jgi:hypothetical protein
VGGCRAQLCFQHAARVQRRAHKHLHQPPVILDARRLLLNRRARIAVTGPVPAALGRRRGGRGPAATAIRWTGWSGQRLPRRGGGTRKGDDAARQSSPGIGAHKAVGEIPVNLNIITVVVIMIIIMIIVMIFVSNCLLNEMN